MVRLDDPQIDVDSLILELEARWEEPSVEFKQALSLRNASVKSEFIKDVLGLATTQGSSRRFLLIGWNDKSRAVQAPGADPALTEQRMQQVLNHYCDPPPLVRYSSHARNGVRVGLLEVVRESLKLPYLVRVKVGRLKSGDAFVRHGTIVEPPTERELESIRQEGINARLREAANPLIRPDQATLRFTGLGLSTAGLLSPEAAVRLQEHNVAVDLVDAVPDQTRKLFQRLQAIHMQGVWEYQMFTLADDYALQVLEHAFATRLIAYYDNRIPLRRGSGRAETIDCDQFQTLRSLVGQGRWRLESRRSPGRSIRFDGKLPALFAWARHEGLLRGQRTRRYDLVFPRMLNATRPLEFGLRMPVDSSRSIREVGEFINQLWGAPTHGGHIFPAPLTRRTMAIGWTQDGGEKGAFWPESLPEREDRSTWEFIVVLGVDTDEAILEFHGDFEVTNFPASLMRGRDDWAGTKAWLADHATGVDEVEVLDRLFVVDVGPSPRPRTVGQFAGLPLANRNGRWIFVRSDFPADAAAHARAVWNRVSDHQVLGECNQCWVDGIASGRWSHVLGSAAAMGADVKPLTPTGIGVPRRDVAVRIQGERDGAVAKHLLDDLGMNGAG